MTIYRDKFCGTGLRGNLVRPTGLSALWNANDETGLTGAVSCSPFQLPGVVNFLVLSTVYAIRVIFRSGKLCHK